MHWHFQRRPMQRLPFQATTAMSQQDRHSKLEFQLFINFMYHDSKHLSLGPNPEIQIVTFTLNGDGYRRPFPNFYSGTWHMESIKSVMIKFRFLFQQQLSVSKEKLISFRSKKFIRMFYVEHSSPRSSFWRTMSTRKRAKEATQGTVKHFMGFTHNHSTTSVAANLCLESWVVRERQTFAKLSIAILSPTVIKPCCCCCCCICVLVDTGTLPSS